MSREMAGRRELLIVRKQAAAGITSIIRRIAPGGRGPGPGPGPGLVTASSVLPGGSLLRWSTSGNIAPSTLRRVSGTNVDSNINSKRTCRIAVSSSSPASSPSIISAITTTRTKARSFHTTAVPLQIHCESGGAPCNCPECQRWRRDPCPICGTNPLDLHFQCRECLEKSVKKYTQQKEERQVSLQNKLAAHLEHIRQIPPGEELIPIDQAVKKLLSSKVGQRGALWDVLFVIGKGERKKSCRNRMCEKLSEELLIRKVGRRIMCDKWRVEAMDFELWYHAENVDDNFWEME